MCQQAGRCARWQTQAAVTAGGLLVGKPPSFVSSFKRNKVWPGGTELSCKTAPRREKKARASVAEVAQVIIRLVRQIKPRPSCLCARRSRALVCDATTCYLHWSSGWILCTLRSLSDPFSAERPLRAPRIHQCRLLCMLSVCSGRRTNPDGTVVLTGEAPECHRHNRNQSIASESIWAAAGSKISSDIGLDSELQIEKWRHFINSLIIYLFISRDKHPLNIQEETQLRKCPGLD